MHEDNAVRALYLVLLRLSRSAAQGAAANAGDGPPS
jgi:hypothetical protein